MRKLLPFIAILFVFTSCEEIVDINLHDGNQQLVVNARFAADSDTLSLRLSTTGRFTDGVGIGPVSNATVSITDQNGNLGLLNETSEGKYELSEYSFVTGNTYTLAVNDGERTIQASSTVPAKAYIDTIMLEAVQFSGFEFTLVHVFTYDPAPEANYFRSRVRVNQLYQNSSNPIADVLNVDGVINVPLLIQSYQAGDTISVELWSMDEAGYQFYRTIDQAANSDPSSTASPFNVSSNVVGGLGLFSLYQRDEYTFIVQ